ncbi:MAG TPA: DUF4232 domain-containing protein [Candidatus Limnocylindrales bacterium]
MPAPSSRVRHPGRSALVSLALLVPALAACVGTAPGSTSSSSPTIAAATASASPTPTATAAGPSPTIPPTPSPLPSTGPCPAGQLAARLTLWEGAAGHRIGHVELTNTGGTSCTVAALDRPQLVDGHGSVLIDGAPPAASATLTMAAGGVLKTLVQDGDYCGPAPVAPVAVAFVLPAGGRVVATPVSPTDATVPPCLSAPGAPGDIEMQAWAP